MICLQAIRAGNLSYEDPDGNIVVDHFMTVGVDTVSPLNDLRDALIEDICLAWSWGSDPLYKIITSSPQVQTIEA